MDVIDWLLDSDPAIRWQVMRDLTGAPGDAVAAERARVAGEGWGARLLALQQPHGQWPAGTPAFPSKDAQQWWRSLGPERQGTLFPVWTSTTWSLALLMTFGVDPDSAAVRHAVGLVRGNVRWEHDGEPYFDGEVEPCINGRTVALGAYFGVDVAPVVERLLGEQMADGGWNCEQENGSTRGSFHTTIDVLEGLLAYERATGSAPDVASARFRGQEYLLERRMFRSLSTGQMIDYDRKTEAPAAWRRFSFPTYWHYDVLRGLEYLRAAGLTPDDRVTEAIDLVGSKRGADGRWPLENPHPGETYFAIDDGEGQPSRWNTLRAMRVLRWHERAGDAGPAALPLRMVRGRAGAEVAQHGEDPAVAGVAGVQPELGEDRVDVLADRAVGDHEGRRDLGVGAALGHQRQHVAFPLGQDVQRVGAPADQ